MTSTESLPNSKDPSRISITPEWTRLPKVGNCPYTGLTRSKLNQLILPTELNGGKPPVRSISLRQGTQRKAVRLINYRSLMSYLDSLDSNPGNN